MPGSGGNARPVDGDNNGSALCDVGAYEVGATDNRAASDLYGHRGVHGRKRVAAGPIVFTAGSVHLGHACGHRRAVAAMRAQQTRLRADVPAIHNPAKRMAGQLMDRLPAIFAADYLVPVARRWKGQISEVGKAWGQFEALPELDHNSVAGTLYPDPFCLLLPEHQQPRPE